MKLILTNQILLYKIQIKEEQKDVPFYPSAGSDESDSDDGEKEKEKGYTVDSDHRLLLRSCLPLLKSRNAAVRVF